MKDVFNYVIYLIGLGSLAFTVYTIRKVPDMISDKLKSNREFELNKALQIDEFYRKDGNLQDIMLEWTHYAIVNGAMENLNTEEGLKKLQILVQKTVGYGSSRTVKLLTEMFQEVYQDNADNRPNLSDESELPDKSGFSTIVIMAMIVSSLKEDFTGQKIEPLDILKIKINDYVNYEDDFKRIIDEINTKLGVNI